MKRFGENLSLAQIDETMQLHEVSRPKAEQILTLEEMQTYLNKGGFVEPVLHGTLKLLRQILFEGAK